MAVGFLCGWSLKARLSREPELGALLASERRARESCENKAALLERAVSAAGSARGESDREWRKKGTEVKIEAPPDCESCLEKAARYVRMEDEKNGWWVYLDRNALDDEPGELALTEKFYNDAAALASVTHASSHENGKAESDEGLHRRSIGMGRPVKSVRAAVGAGVRVSWR